MLLRVTKTEALTPSIRLIRLEDPAGAPLPEFDAGSHIELGLRVGDALVQRKYSLVSEVAERRYYEIAVKRNVHGRGASLFIHDRLAMGDELEVSPPASEFRIARDGQRFILIAGGVGITPMLSLLTALEQAEMPHELHYSARNEHEMAFRDRLSTARAGAVFLYFTQGPQPGRIGIEALLERHAGDKDTHVYVCGPAGLIDQVRLAAAARGIKQHRIHFESFGPAWQPDDEKVALRLSESGMDIEVEPGTTLLDAMEAAGAWIGSECRRGECGACITTYTTGTPVHRDSCLTAEQRKSSFCPCVSWAKGGEPLSLQI